MNAMRDLLIVDQLPSPVYEWLTRTAEKEIREAVESMLRLRQMFEGPDAPKVPPTSSE